MQLHEYQAKNILKKYGIPSPSFFVASSLEEVQEIVMKQHLQEAVVKVQVHAGGRGKAGGVKFARSREEIVQHTERLLGMKVVSPQTGPDGVIAHSVLLTAPVDIAKEYYVGIVIDRQQAQVTLLLSQEGGMEIEEVAKKAPHKIMKLPLSKETPLEPALLEKAVQFLGLKHPEAKRIILALIDAFFATDAELLELNPLVETKKGELLALDAKLTIDDNALFRHPELVSLYDDSQLSPLEKEARKHELAFVPLKGSIGCMVNGAGLAMATMDIISLKGGKKGCTPANFLDIGGSATEEKVVQGFELLLSDPQVKAILINIFGGIMNCETIAQALQKVIEKKELTLPVVVRMEGTHAKEAKELLRRLKGSIIAADSFDTAAQKVVELCQS